MIRFTLTVSLRELERRYGDQYPCITEARDELVYRGRQSGYDIAIDWYYTDPKDRCSRAIDEVLELYFKEENTTIAYNSPVVLLVGDN